MIKLTWGTVEDCKEIEDEPTGDTHRWTRTHRRVFEYEGIPHITFYEVAATEAQEGSGTDWSEELECYPAHQVEITTRVWKAIR